MATHPILDRVDAVYVVNLPARTDRKAEMESELRKLDKSFSDPKIHLFPAVRPETPEGFPSIGARGCFMSHLGILADAKSAGHDSIFILEDDADFTKQFLNPTESQAEAIWEPETKMVYFGHRLSQGSERLTFKSELAELPSDVSVMTSHAIFLRRQAIELGFAYLTQLLTRPAGHPDGGPMHVDGAYSWFRNSNAELKTLVTQKEWVVQRASRTDIHVTGLKEKLPFISLLRRLKNRIK